MHIKRLGDYLIEQKLCETAVVEEAVRYQKELAKDGIYKPIGELLTESGACSFQNLKTCIRKQAVDMLSMTELYKQLPMETIEWIADLADYKLFTKGQIVFRHGEPGDSFCQIISGLVRVYQLSDDGEEVTLAEIGASEVFGDMALLTGECRSASVAALEPTSLLEISNQALEKIVAKCPEVSLAFSRILADRLAQGNDLLLDATLTEKAYQQFIAEHTSVMTLALIGESKVFKNMLAEANALAASTKPVFVAGPAGTEKEDVAALIHKKSGPSESPFLVMNAKHVKLNPVMAVYGESDPLRLELAQSIMLFGSEKGGMPLADRRRLGLLQVAHGGTILIKNIECLAPKVQEQLVAFIQDGRFRPLGSMIDFNTRVRIVATAETGLDQVTADGRLSPQLYNLFASRFVVIPGLLKRRKDIRLLAEHLIQHYSSIAGKNITGMTQDSYQRLMAYDWPGNTAELKTVIKRAVSVSRQEELSVEDILIGAVRKESGWRWNLLQEGKILSFFQHTYYPLAGQLLTGIFFLIIIILGFWGSKEPQANMALSLTWGLWEPLVVLSAITLGRVWCGICPVGAVSSWVSGKTGQKAAVPAFLRNYGIYIGSAGIALIFLSETLFDMQTSARATAVLIVILTVLAVTVALIYRRRVWCRYLCPLGKMVGLLARCSVLELRANNYVCNSDCTDNFCYVGHESVSGCPVFKAPFSLASNQNCILCGNCIKICPNKSPVLNLRLPASGLWSFRRPDSAMSILVCFLAGSQVYRGMEMTGWFSAMHAWGSELWLFQTSAMAVTIVIMFGVLIVGVNTDQDESYMKAVSRRAYILLPVVAAFELSFHLERFAFMGGNILPVFTEQFGLPIVLPALDMGEVTVKLLQVLFVVSGYVAARIVQKKNFLQVGDGQGNLAVASSFPLLLITAVYLYFFLWN